MDGNIENLENIALATNVSRSQEFKNDPFRANTFIIHTNEPFNAESPSKLLINYPLTPDKLFYHRNHSPIPDLSEKNYSVSIIGEVKNPGTITLSDIKKFKKRTVEAILMCTGNRRSEFGSYKKSAGLPWKGGSIGNAQWAGTSLRDILEKFVPKDSCLHIEFIGGDQQNSNFKYNTSIPVTKALDLDVILCYEMNGKVLSRDHGYPLRVIVPGYSGARMVKWLSAIELRVIESVSQYHVMDYKLFKPSLELAKVTKNDWIKADAIKEVNINSYICNLYDGDIVNLPFSVKGYAYSSGNKIWRVDFSYDGGKSWMDATILNPKTGDSNQRYYGWTLWEYKIIPETLNTNNMELCVRAWDSALNTQPLDISSLWNFRGFMNNVVHRVRVSTVKPEIKPKL